MKRRFREIVVTHFIVFCSKGSDLRVSYHFHPDLIFVKDTTARGSVSIQHIDYDATSQTKDSSRGEFP